MTDVLTALSISLDGYVAGANDRPGQPLGDGGDRLFEWLYEGDTPSRFDPDLVMSATSAAFFDEEASRLGAAVAGRRTYDVSEAWDGEGPVPKVPLFVVTHEAPEAVPDSDPPYTFVQEGVEHAVALATEAAQGKDVCLLGASMVQQCLRAGLMNRLILHLVPTVLGRGVRLLEGFDPEATRFELERVVDAPGVTHLSYRILTEPPS